MSYARICDGCGTATQEWDEWWLVGRVSDRRRRSLFSSDDDDKTLHLCSLACLAELAFKWEMEEEPAA